MTFSKIKIETHLTTPGLFFRYCGAFVFFMNFNGFAGLLVAAIFVLYDFTVFALDVSTYFFGFGTIRSGRCCCLSLGYTNTYA
jgi:hypothetical protein